MLEDNDDIRPHDWLEAEKMVDALLDEGKRDEFQMLTFDCNVFSCYY